MRVGIIANPHAGRRRTQMPADGFCRRLQAAGIEVELAMTRHPGHGQDLARELARTVDAVAVVGGDGTVHEVANGLMPRPVPMAILPAGTGNDFASLVGAQPTVDALVECLRTGSGVRLDVLDLGDRYAINSVGMGFEGLANRYSHGIRWARGPLVYYVAIFRALAALEYPEFRVTTDSESWQGPQFLISIGNGNRVGGGFRLTPDACPDDGLMDICSVDPMPRWKVLRLLPAAGRGAHTTHPRVHMRRCENVTIETDRDFPIHVDGELVDPAPRRLELRVCRRALPVLCGPHISPVIEQVPTQIL